MNRRRDIGRGTGRLPLRLAIAGAAAAIVVAAAGIALGTPPASAADPAIGPHLNAPGGGTSTAVGTGASPTRLVVTPTAGLPPSGAQITVSGSGFDPGHDLWVAVCQDDGVAPAALLRCVGGPIPNQNATAGWGVVTSAKQPPYPGPVVTSWGSGGSFELTLQLPSALSQAADCVSAPCSVYTRSADDDDRSQDLRVGIAFAPPPGLGTSGTTPTTGSAGTTAGARTIGGVPTTVSPEIILQTAITAGAEQTVLFTGFVPDEDVDVTLYSDPLTLPPAVADSNGNVRISFNVPADLPPGEHLLQAVGRQSGRVGIAQFSVAAPQTASETATTSATETSDTSTTASQSAESTTEASPTASSESQTALPAGSSASTPSGVALPGDSGGGGGRLLWLWLAIAVIVVVGGAAGVVTMVRSRRERTGGLPMAAASVATPTETGRGFEPAEPGGPGPSQWNRSGPPTVEPTGGFGLLAGRDHPEGPGMYAGAGWGGEPGAGAAGGPATQQWRPDGAGQPSSPAPDEGGPATQQWRPDFPGEGDAPRGEEASPADGGDETPPGDGPAGGRHRID